ncbi:accessory factor UbiK family protein [Pseudomonas typographi]|uniref:Ubiquinone biosynthesis accessory factor UbiK n=1 Tax=Pseudomonas typographi TaxID=2715964 RepID=A0ABR7Z325_9PSED|nr:accessory factor UbiK family protein [Pseudomonas typographi]MBD1550198.1 accessory factor UbiK family protein [Pseudomonas typographi]MBD1586042.1 accessory factor UbiK family protein [Pseudomonas typographi]MBD1599900.1 accessory factor UbiK family protein [Pseudomonas typographi]
MRAPKEFIDALAGQAARLLDGPNGSTRAEAEGQLRALLQAAFAKLELVSREEFDSQMAVLARTRTKVDALEGRLAELEAKAAEHNR